MLLAYPPRLRGHKLPHERRKQDQFGEAIRAVLARQSPVAERPGGLPRGRVVERRLQMGMKRIRQGALPAAWIALCGTHNRAQTDDAWRSSSATYAAGRFVELLSPERDPEQRANVLHRSWKRHRSVLHLAMPLLVRLGSKQGSSFGDLLVDLSWAVPKEAEIWRAVIIERYPSIRPEDLLPTACVISGNY
jgi:hypothetical protein